MRYSTRFIATAGIALMGLFPLSAETLQDWQLSYGGFRPGIG